MGWFATYKALKDGSGPYGTVEQSLKRECDPPRTLRIALDALERDDPQGPNRGS